jgi:hypothetical protein
MRLEKRLRALEARLRTEPVILYFADGSTKEICGQGDFLLGLFRSACGEVNLYPAQSAQLDLIRECVAAIEPGGGHMVELIQGALNRPVESSMGELTTDGPLTASDPT